MLPDEVALANLIMSSSAWSLVITLPDTLFEKRDSQHYVIACPVALDERGNSLTTGVGLLYSTPIQTAP
jgi:hypothetical protein